MSVLLSLNYDEASNPHLDAEKIQTWRFLHNLMYRIFFGNAPIFSVNALLAYYERILGEDKHYTLVDLERTWHDIYFAWSNVGSIELEGTTMAFSLEQGQPLRGTLSRELPADIVRHIYKQMQDVPRTEDEILEAKLKAAFSIETLEPIEQVYIARLAVDFLIKSANRARSLIVFKALKLADYKPQDEAEMDAGLLKSLPGKDYYMIYGTNSQPIQEQLIEAKNHLNKDVRTIAQEILTLFEIDTNDDNAQAQFSRAQIIEALRKTGANPKLAAARLLQG
jgi:hypothetical protein